MKTSRLLVLSSHAVLLVALLPSCANRELERRQIVKMRQIRDVVRVRDEQEREELRIAAEREEQRRKEEREARELAARVAAEERRERREREQERRIIICAIQNASEDVCQDFLRKHFGGPVASGACNVAMQKLTSGTVDWGDAVLSVGADMATSSDDPLVQGFGYWLKAKSYERCVNGG